MQASSRPVSRAEIGQLFAMVEGENAQLRPLLTAAGDPVQVVEALVDVRARQPIRRAAGSHQGSTLGRHRRRAAVAGDHQRPAGVGVTASLLPAFVVEPAAQQTRHKGISGAQHVENPPRARPAVAAPGPSCPGCRLPAPRSHRPALADESGFGGIAHIFQRGQGIGAAPGNMKLFFPVPTTKSNRCSTSCSWLVTGPDSMKRVSPSPSEVSPHSTGR